MHTLQEQERVAGAREVAERWEAMVSAQQALLAASITGLPTEELERRFIMSEEAFRAAQPGGSLFRPTVTSEFDDLADVQAGLAPDEVALIFHLDDPASFRLLIQKDAWQLDVLPGKSRLAPLIDDYFASITDVQRSGPRQGRQIASMLIPAALHASATPATVLVQAHDVLNRLPFAVLPLDDDRDARPLISGHRLITVHSLSDY